MKIEQKQNRIYKPQSVYTYAAEECNQVSTELDNLIREGGLTPSAGDLTQVKTAVNNIVDTAANNLQEQIVALENSITARNLRAAIQGDEFALNKITEVEAQITELRKQLEESK